MPIVFVHGVANRWGADLERGVRDLEVLFRTVSLPLVRSDPEAVKIFLPYWGDLGGNPSAGGTFGTLPSSGDFETFGSGPAFPELLTRDLVQVIATQPDQPLLATARQVSLPCAIDLLWACAVESVQDRKTLEEMGKFIAQAFDYAERSPSPRWLTEVSNDLLLVLRLKQEVEVSRKTVESFGLGDWWGYITSGATTVRDFAQRSLVGLPRNLGSQAGLYFLRPWMTTVGARTIGDALAYVARRGTEASPGDIVQRVVKDVIAAAAERTDSDPLIAIGHSLGGVILYDLFSHFAKNLRCDVLVTVGSQVGFFRELGLLAQLSPSAASPTNRISRPANMHRWLNIFDSVDGTFVHGSASLRRSRGLLVLKRDGCIIGSYVVFLEPSLSSATGPANSGIAPVTLVAGDTAPLAAPRTHVLIIGVGDYPDANRTLTARNYSTLLGVSSITSSTLSARSIADWLLTKFHNPKAELGSIELFLSEPKPAIYCNPKTNTEKAIDRADFAGIQGAFRDWESQCDADPGNIGVFYFCGHAAEGANRILIPSDFPVLAAPKGEEPDWNKLVNFNSTHTNMRYCKAAHQFYFLDCCRTRLPKPLAGCDLGVPLIFPRLGCSLAARAQPVYAIPEGMTTGGIPGQTSNFTDLLLHSLRGAGAEPHQRTWQVTATRLVRACREIAEVFEEGLSGSPYPQIELDFGGPMADDPILHQYHSAEPPLVPACVRCQPRTAAIAGDYSALNATGSFPLSRRFRNYAHGFLTPGDYTIRLTFPAGDWIVDDMNITVDPPICKCDLVARNV